MENLSEMLSLSRKGDAMTWSTPGGWMRDHARVLMQQCHHDHRCQARAQYDQAESLSYLSTRPRIFLPVP